MLQIDKVLISENTNVILGRVRTINLDSRDADAAVLDGCGDANIALACSLCRGFLYLKDSYPDKANVFCRGFLISIGAFDVT